MFFIRIVFKESQYSSLYIVVFHTHCLQRKAILIFVYCCFSYSLSSKKVSTHLCILLFFILIVFKESQIFEFFIRIVFKERQYSYLYIVVFHTHCLQIKSVLIFVYCCFSSLYIVVFHTHCLRRKSVLIFVYCCFSYALSSKKVSTHLCIWLFFIRIVFKESQYSSLYIVVFHTQCFQRNSVLIFVYCCFSYTLSSKEVSTHICILLFFIHIVFKESQYSSLYIVVFHTHCLQRKSVLIYVYCCFSYS